VNADQIHDRLSQVEAYLTSEFEAKALDAGAYVDGIHALADAHLALARAGKPTAERPMRQASEAESRFQRRARQNVRARLCVQAAIAASLCAAEGVDQQAGEWLSQLKQTLPHLSTWRTRSRSPIALEARRFRSQSSPNDRRIA
jgi:hypothetical protein